jgi:hypothetical protein
MDNTKWITTMSPEDMEALNKLSEDHEGTAPRIDISSYLDWKEDFISSEQAALSPRAKLPDGVDVEEYLKRQVRRRDMGEDAMPVYLAWYHDGYTDNSPDLLGVCVHPRKALRLLQEHRDTRDATYEYKDEARWWIEQKELLCGLG